MDSDGPVLTEQKQIVDWVKRYTEELYNKPDDKPVLERLNVGEENVELEILWSKTGNISSS